MLRIVGNEFINLFESFWEYGPTVRPTTNETKSRFPKALHFLPLLDIRYLWGLKRASHFLQRDRALRTRWRSRMERFLEALSTFEASVRQQIFWATDGGCSLVDHSTTQITADFHPPHFFISAAHNIKSNTGLRRVECPTRVTSSPASLIPRSSGLGPIAEEYHQLWIALAYENKPCTFIPLQVQGRYGIKKGK